jgi:hypothetical protein
MSEMSGVPEKFVPIRFVQDARLALHAIDMRGNPHADAIHGANSALIRGLNAAVPACPGDRPHACGATDTPDAATPPLAGGEPLGSQTGAPGGRETQRDEPGVIEPPATDQIAELSGRLAVVERCVAALESRAVDTERRIDLLKEWNRELRRSDEVNRAALRVAQGRGDALEKKVAWLCEQMRERGAKPDENCVHSYAWVDTGEIRIGTCQKCGNMAAKY